MEETTIIRIAILGAESTGKSTLVKQLANHFNTSYVNEYAREYFEKHNLSNFQIHAFDEIYSTQIKLEKEATLKANRFLFCDTSLITGKIWCEEVFGILSPYLAENWNKIKYDLYLVTKNDVQWVKDDQRKNPHNREELLQQNIDLIKTLKSKYEFVEGIGEQRLINAIKIIESNFG